MKKWLPRLGQILGPLLVRALVCTLRIRYSNPEVERQLLDQGSFIYCFWHRWILLPAYTHRHRGVVVLISRHRDGEIISRIIEKLGFETARGSSTRGGTQALHDLQQAAAEGRVLAITPDGPRGPSKSIAPGIVALSARAGLPILPCGFAMARERCLNTWDRFVVPRAFRRVQIAFAEPIQFTSDDLRTVPMEALTERVRTAMMTAEARAEKDLSA